MIFYQDQETTLQVGDMLSYDTKERTFWAGRNGKFIDIELFSGKERQIAWPMLDNEGDGTRVVLLLAACAGLYAHFRGRDGTISDYQLFRSRKDVPEALIVKI